MQQFPHPGRFWGQLAFAEDHIGFHLLRVEQAGRQVQSRMEIALVQPLLVDCLTAARPGVLKRLTKSSYLFDMVTRKPSRSMIFFSVDTLPSAPLITVLPFLPMED